MDAQPVTRQVSRLKTTDGLRAFAIIAVVLFHTFPHLAPGGFIGVDVFFVISGFIITLIYEQRLVDGRTSFKDFYLRRVKRLAPAYILLVVTVSLAAIEIMRPSDLTNYGWSLIFQGFYAQNIAFWHIGDYFEGPLTKPLLHTWTLAVEEQFYLTFPLFILAVARFPRSRTMLLLVVAAASLLLGWKVAAISPKTSFFWLPTRVWEFAAGILAAGRYRARPMVGSGGKAMVALGSVAILAAVFGFDERSFMPSAQTLLAVGGTAAVLLGQDAGWTRVYEARLSQHFGLMSYSWYLWHWPPLALYFVVMGARPNVPLASLLAVLGYGLGYGSYVFVERRTRAAAWSFKQALGLLAAFCLAAVVGGTLILQCRGFVRSYPRGERALFAAQLDVPPYRCPLLARLRMWDRAVCRVSRTPGRPILLIGDSHVDRFKELLANYPLLITKQNCTALEYGERRECNWSDIVRDVRELHVSRIVLVAHWGRSYTPAQYLKLQQDLAQVGVPVTLLLPTPEGPAFDPATYLKRGTFPEFTPVTQAQVRSETFEFRTAIGKIGQDDDNVTLVDPLPVLCPSRCRFALDGTPIYRDGNHLTIQGARLIVSQISQTFLNDDIRQRHGSNRSPF